MDKMSTSLILKADDVKQEKCLSNRRRIAILGVNVDALNMEETVDLVEKYIETKTPLHLMGVNADKINEAKKNLLMKKIVNSCGVINADGASVVLASKYLSKDPLSERVAGIDLMMELVLRCAEKGYKVYLLGAKQRVVEKTCKELKKRYSGVRIVGVHDGFFRKGDWPEVSKKIKKANPDIVFVGITSPTKEYLIEYLQNAGHKEVFMGVGGSFDVISGEIRRAPKWMQKCNLEWLYRMLQEPGRLFKRYFIGNTIFIARVIKERMKGKR